jgi:hypothetical protein
MNNYAHKSQGGQSKYHTNMALLSELHSLCSDMTFYLERRALPKNADKFDPQVISFTFRIARNGRDRFLSIVSELSKTGVSFGIGVREIDSDTLSSNWIQLLSGPATPVPNTAIWRKEFYSHLRRSTTNCQARLEFTPSEREDELGQINLVVILNPGLLEKFEFAVEELSALGAKGYIKLAEQSV